MRSRFMRAIARKARASEGTVTSGRLAAPPTEFALYVNRELPAQIAFLTQFTVGLIYYTEENFPAALTVRVVTMSASSVMMPVPAGNGCPSSSS